MGSKLASVTGWGNTVTYGYAGDGKRNFRVLNSSVTHAYHWDAGYNVVNEANSSGTLTKSYVVRPRKLGAIGEIQGANPATGSYRYYTSDQIDSVRGVFDQTKVSTGTAEFTPFGSNLYSHLPSDITRRFGSLDFDSITGHSYAPLRYYLPMQSRWLTKDDLDMVDSTNVYAFVRYNPINNIDPVGARTLGIGGRIEVICPYRQGKWIELWFLPEDDWSLGWLGLGGGEGAVEADGIWSLDRNGPRFKIYDGGVCMIFCLDTACDELSGYAWICLGVTSIPGSFPKPPTK